MLYSYSALLQKSSLTKSRILCLCMEILCTERCNVTRTDPTSYDKNTSRLQAHTVWGQISDSDITTRIIKKEFRHLRL